MSARAAPESSVLANGMRIVSESMPMRSVALGVWVEAGARYEGDDEHGAAHVLEHMAFKGTQRRNAYAIVEEIESVGGYLNAATGQETISYYARILAPNMALGADLLADILLHPSLDAGELERERQVILQEIAQSQDNAEELVLDRLLQASFPDNPLGRPILGTEASISKTDAKKLQNYMGKHFSSSRMILSAAGDITHTQLRELAQKHFYPIESDATAPSKQAAFHSGYDFRQRDLEQGHLCFGFAGVANDHPDYYAAQVCNALLGGGMSSRLFQEARERRALCYSISSFSWSFRDCGLFGVQAAAAPEKLGELAAVIRGEIEDIATGINDDEIERARAQCRVGALMASESPAACCEHNATQALANASPVSLEESAAHIEAVDGERVRRFAASLLVGGGSPACAIVAPQEPKGSLW